ncbi:MbcA/ParS/Xre antitoxin family protein [Pseudooceanicola nanhaiensis]|uniref:MbcA/ParS/Xre antitoxin family protein n=1 Tax=Pseudooceanicola nanhaiensis TaxID=375761 RepID=UPI001CD476A3|nr:MbcA/ParS/Xre antitoxin family protein [Pseudooceanicola nanhaiensis]MCA0922934.1 MbcA/ParS/Xre antitoxin family protein [Pseudooceanicola nanhaiensis]
MALQRVESPRFDSGPRPLPHDASALTEEEGGAMLRALINLFDRWGLEDREAATLLGQLPRTYVRWKQGSTGRFGPDVLARMSNLLGIHKALRLIFVEPSRGYAWIKAPNEAFGGRSALEVMMGGALTDLMRVRRYLDAERGGW